MFRTFKQSSIKNLQKTSKPLTKPKNTSPKKPTTTTPLKTFQTKSTRQDNASFNSSTTLLTPTSLHMSTTTQKDPKNTPLVPKIAPNTPVNPYSNVKSIICLVRTYSEHAKELGNAIPPNPIVFLKPPSCLIMEHNIGNNKIEMPPTCTNLHHEIELGVIIGKKGRDITTDNAMEYVSGYFLGLDMTAREIQGEAKKQGLPWSIAKGYDTFGPVSPPINKDLIPDPSKLRMELKVNGKIKQNCTTDLLLFNIPELLSFISQYFTLHPGDMIFTGTPAGVGPVVIGDVIQCELRHVGSEQLITEMEFGVVQRPSPAGVAKL
jgi:acylpyruvate hydrolase